MYNATQRDGGVGIGARACNRCFVQGDDGSGHDQFATHGQVDHEELAVGVPHQHHDVAEEKEEQGGEGVDLQFGRVGGVGAKRDPLCAIGVWGQEPNQDPDPEGVGDEEYMDLRMGRAKRKQHDTQAHANQGDT